jgi:hypothetical protein
MMPLVLKLAVACQNVWQEMFTWLAYYICFPYPTTFDIVSTFFNFSPDSLNFSLDHINFWD